MKKTFLILAPSFVPIDGGGCALHQLCHILRSIGEEAFLIPQFHERPMSFLSMPNAIESAILEKQKVLRGEFKVNPAWTTPIFDKPLSIIGQSNQYIAIYPEITFGNPLQAKNVVRWILYHVGFHQPHVYIQPTEYLIRYLPSYYVPTHNLKQIIGGELFVALPPFDIYAEAGKNSKGHREGVALAIRKGRAKYKPADFPDAIVIDGKSHEEVSKIFASVKTFVSLDPMTMFSQFAVLAGCDSVVIPDPGITKDQWGVPEADRAGIAYGFEDLEEARQTRTNIESVIGRYSSESFANVSRFVNIAEKLFG